MKNFYRVVPNLPKPATPHAKACMERIRTMLGKPLSQEEVETKQADREPGSDDE